MSAATRAPRLPNAGKAGAFRIGGAISVNRLGFGAMRVTGPGVWGEPEDRDEALRTLKHLPALGVNFVDTANSYGPEVSERLIREALHPYVGILVATKAGLTRPGPGQWVPFAQPDYLMQEARKSRDLLGVEKIGLWQLHRIDPNVPRDEQFDAVRMLLDQGVIQHAGLSNVSVAEIEAAAAVFPVATVQNRYNLVDRGSEDVLAYCERHGIGFIPWFPLAAGDLGQARIGARCRRPAPRRNAGPDRARLAAQAQPGDAADPGHLEGRASGRKRRRGEHRIVGADFAALDREGKNQFQQ